MVKWVYPNRALDDSLPPPGLIVLFTVEDTAIPGGVFVVSGYLLQNNIGFWWQTEDGVVLPEIVAWTYVPDPAPLLKSSAAITA